jgi:hypothetical protein
MRARLIPFILAVGVLGVLVLKLLGSEELQKHIDVSAVILVAFVVVLGFIIAAPGEAKKFLKRMTSLKVGAIEVGLQATTLVERVELRVPAPTDDNVGAVEKRNVGGSAAEEFDEVRGKLVERLHFARDAILELDNRTAKPSEIIASINDEKLLAPDEEQVVRDLLGDAKEEVCLLDADVRKRYLDGAWRFSSRFATLILERRVRNAMVAKKWLLLDFGQTRGHRPDFIAFREEVWLVATRVDAGDAQIARGRLGKQLLPIEARRVIVHPDSMKEAADAIDDPVTGVELVAFSEIEAAAKVQRTWKAPLSR